MSPSRSPFLLLGVACGLAAIAGYLAIATEASGDSPFLLPEVLAGEPGAARPEAAAAPDAAGGVLRLTLEIEPLARLAPGQAPSRGVRVTRAGVPVPAEVEWVAGPAAAPGVALVGPSLARLRLADGSVLYRVVHAASPGEVPAEIALLAPAACTGRVQDPQGRAVAGARVWLAGAETTTDAAGEFAFAAVPGSAGRDVPVAVEAAGHAGHAATIGLPAGSAPLRFVLERGGRARVRFLAPRVAGAVARLYLLPGRGENSSALLHHPFHLQALRGGWPLGEGDEVVVDGLPIDADLEAWIVDPLRPAPAPVAFRVRAGRSAEVAVRGHASAVLHGVIRSADGAPLRDALVVAAGEGEAVVSGRAGWLLPPEAYLRAGAFARSDAEGRYRIALPGRRQSGVRVLAAGLGVQEVTVAASAGEVAREFVLHPAAAVAGEPGLRLALPGGRRWLVRVVDRGRTLRPWFAWSGGDPLTLPLREPCVVRVRALVEGVEAPLAECASLPVAGPVDVVLAGRP
ncbi:MAG: carboxypeptidase regulatory-like domain-containing protein [Planctomycetes bacterium]|nr:carboxypeptidase regulatory-like domain-containing protein [Planctomycetota bacterium]